jgi:hypothetical protein
MHLIFPFFTDIPKIVYRESVEVYKGHLFR